MKFFVLKKKNRCWWKIVEATLPKVQKLSNMILKKEQEVDAAPSNNKPGLSDAIQISHEDGFNEKKWRSVYR